MNRLNQESKIESISLTGEVEGATVRLNFSRENDAEIRQINAHANKQRENGGQLNVFIDYQTSNNGVNINATGCGMDVPFELIESLLLEMQEVYNNQKTTGGGKKN